MFRLKATVYMMNTGIEIIQNTKLEYPPGDLAVWVLIYAELLVFSLFFIGYAFARMRHPDMFATGQLTLNPRLGLLNTALLLSSGWLAAAAVLSSHQGRQSLAFRKLILAVVIGCGFLLTKGYEIAHHFGMGYDLDTDTFHFLYLFMGSFHFLHVFLGVGILILMALKVHKGDYRPAAGVDQSRGLESGAAYWHMVDIVWLILFPLVYLMGHSGA